MLILLGESKLNIHTMYLLIECNIHTIYLLIECNGDRRSRQGLSTWVMSVRIESDWDIFTPSWGFVLKLWEMRKWKLSNETNCEIFTPSWGFVLKLWEVRKWKLSNETNCDIFTPSWGWGLLNETPNYIYLRDMLTVNEIMQITLKVTSSWSVSPSLRYTCVSL